jgi:hypothetical protein
MPPVPRDFKSRHPRVDWPRVSRSGSIPSRNQNPEQWDRGGSSGSHEWDRGGNEPRPEGGEEPWNRNSESYEAWDLGGNESSLSWAHPSFPVSGPACYAEDRENPEPSSGSAGLAHAIDSTIALSLEAAIRSGLSSVIAETLSAYPTLALRKPLSHLGMVTLPVSLAKDLHCQIFLDERTTVGGQDRRCLLESLPCVFVDPGNSTYAALFDRVFTAHSGGLVLEPGHWLHAYLQHDSPVPSLVDPSGLNTGNKADVIEVVAALLRKLADPGSAPTPSMTKPKASEVRTKARTNLWVLEALVVSLLLSGSRSPEEQWKIGSALFAGLRTFLESGETEAPPWAKSGLRPQVEAPGQTRTGEILPLWARSGPGSGASVPDQTIPIPKAKAGEVPRADFESETVSFTRVCDFLEEARLEEFKGKFKEHGFDDMETVMSMDFTNMSEVGMSGGHMHRFKASARKRASRM